MYRRCGFRCNEFTPNAYAGPYESGYRFGHMIRMELDLENVLDLPNICLDPKAVNISSENEDISTKQCNAKLPQGLHSTC